MPPVSEAQRRWAWAAAAGHVKGVPSSVGKEFASSDPGGKLPARAKDLAPEKFGAIKNALRYLVEFFSEEEREPEHETAEDEPTLSKADVKYGSGKPGARCAECKHFTAPDACQLVKGAISPDGWCDRFIRSVAQDTPKGRAASVAFVCPDGRTLFVRRRATDESDHYAGKWCWPGGRCEEDEEFADAAQREAREEAGEDCTFDNMSELHRVRTDRGWDHVTYVVPVKAPFQPTLDDECDGHVWATPDALPEPLHPGCKRTMDESFEKLEHSLAHRKGVKDPDALAAWIGRRSGKIPADTEFEEGKHPRGEGGKFASAQHAEITEAGFEHKRSDPSSSTYEKKPDSGAYHPHGHVLNVHHYPKSGKTWMWTHSAKNAEGRPGIKIGEGKTAKSLSEHLSRHNKVKDESTEAKARAHGALTERERQTVNPHVKARADKPASVYLLPDREKYPVKTHEDGEWRYNRDLLLAAAREARMHGRTDLARRADAIREREFGEEREGARDASPWAIALDKAAERRATAIDWSRFGPPKPRAIAMDKSMREIDADGRMHVDESNISKATVNPYLGREIPNWEKLGLDPEKKYMLLRHPDELKKAAGTFNGLPIFDKHRPASATDHPKEITVGATGNDAKFEHPYLKNSLVIWPEYATKAVENGDLGEISCGYAYRPDMTPGTYDGQHYDGVMRDIVGNHVAIVREGRAGPDVKVADEAIFSFRKTASR